MPIPRNGCLFLSNFYHGVKKLSFVERAVRRAEKKMKHSEDDFKKIIIPLICLKLGFKIGCEFEDLKKMIVSDKK